MQYTIQRDYLHIFIMVITKHSKKGKIVQKRLKINPFYFFSLHCACGPFGRHAPIEKKLQKTLILSFWELTTNLYFFPHF